MRTVLVRTGGVEGAMRRPAVRHVWGDVDSTTTITQHGIKYRCDPARVMFSAGNLEERRRMAGLPAAGETVVDLFAGLGYLSLPLAVHAGPRRVVACEINPEAAAFLQQNVALNGVADRFEVRQGDNRLVAPRGVADRVLMGYLHDTWSWLPLADEVLKPEGGVIHYHFKAPDEQWPSKVLAQVQEHLGGRPTRLLGFQRVKPYAPRVLHGVLDVEVGPR
jgi:tRNA wybutosine-synthesizing protein 2